MTQKHMSKSYAPAVLGHFPPKLWFLRGCFSSPEKPAPFCPLMHFPVCHPSAMRQKRSDAQLLFGFETNVDIGHFDLSYCDSFGL